MTRGTSLLIPPNARNLKLNMEKLSEPLSSGMSFIIYSWVNTDTDSFYLLSFEDIMAVLEDLDEGLKSSWATSVEDDDWLFKENDKTFFNIIYLLTHDYNYLQISNPVL